MSPWGWVSITVFGFAPMAAAIYFAVADDKARRQVIDATRRIEIVNGGEYSVYTLKHPVLREREVPEDLAYHLSAAAKMIRLPLPVRS
jgi:hypothetical protein